MLGLELAFGKWSMSFIVFQAGQSNDFTRSRRSPSPSCPRSMSEKRANQSWNAVAVFLFFFLVSALWTWHDKIVSYISLAALYTWPVNGSRWWLSFSFSVPLPFPFSFVFFLFFSLSWSSPSPFPFSFPFFSFPCPFPFRFLFHFWALFFWVQFKSFFEPVTLEFEL